MNVVLNFEEGSEPSVPDGDAASEWGLTEYGGRNPGVAGRDLAVEGMFTYGSRVRSWRIMRLFAERALPLTVFGCARALERDSPRLCGGSCLLARRRTRQTPTARGRSSFY
jgi:allantoinase